MKTMIDLNALPAGVTALFRLAHRARKLSELWVDLPSRHSMGAKLLSDFEKLKIEATPWPPKEEQFAAWSYPDVPHPMGKDILAVFAMGLETLGYLQMTHAELTGELRLSDVQLDISDVLLAELREKPQPIVFRHSSRSTRRDHGL